MGGMDASDTPLVCETSDGAEVNMMRFSSRICLRFQCHTGNNFRGGKDTFRVVAYAKVVTKRELSCPLSFHINSRKSSGIFLEAAQYRL